MGFDIDIRVLKGDMHAGAKSTEDQIVSPPSAETSSEVTLISNDKRTRTDDRKEIERSTKKKKKSTASVQRSIAENFRC